MKSRIAVAAAVLVGSAFTYLGHAQAFESWCFDDPVVQIGNEMVQTTVGVYGEPSWIRAHVQSATITYHLPSNVHGAKVKSTTTPYFAENVVFDYDEPAVPKGQPVSTSVSVTFKTDAVGARAMVQMVNTVQSAGKGPQTGPDQGAAFTVTTVGSASAGLTASGLVPQTSTTDADARWSTHGAH